jgi:homopolymeric O-antigen transport system ATP-binding protein
MAADDGRPRGKLAVRTEGLGKAFRLGEERGHDLLSERLGAALRGPLRLRPGARRAPPEEFWALRDVSFELHRGEAVGLIGRNGAGKSTLLQLLSRIARPTEGRVMTFGRLAALLEVGTGFHPELTGRENVYLNGTILGMRRREIEARFDEIVEFSGVERFLDTPVKRYSSGMHVRLGFAVAAHLDPEIMLVDEVLAVGDTEFQRRCLGKMQDVAGEGRAVVFVSHNLVAVQKLCDRALLIESGRLVADGPVGAVTAEYLDHVQPDQASGVAVIRDDTPRRGLGGARLRRVRMTDLDRNPTSSVYLGQRFLLAATFDVEHEIEAAAIEFGISTMEGQRVATSQNIDGDRPPAALARGTWEVEAELVITMLPGEYNVDVGIHAMSRTTVDAVDRALRFTALNAAETGGDHWPWRGVRGYVRPESSWRVLNSDSAATVGPAKAEPGAPRE